MDTDTPLVMLSGLLCDSFVWQKVAHALQDAIKGTIHSFAGCNSIPEMAERVLKAAPSRFALAGHSMGGRVALEVFRQQPQRVSRLALLNTGAHPRSDAEVATRTRLLDIASTRGMAAMADEWLPPMMSPTGRSNDTLMRHLKAMVLRHSENEFRGQIKALLDRPDATRVLPNIHVPTLFLSGDQDQWSPPLQHEAMQQQVPGSRLVILPGVGHMSTVEAPQQIANALESWLRE